MSVFKDMTTYKVLKMCHWNTLGHQLSRIKLRGWFILFRNHLAETTGDNKCLPKLTYAYMQHSMDKIRCAVKQLCNWNVTN